MSQLLAYESSLVLDSRIPSLADSSFGRAAWSWLAAVRGQRVLILLLGVWILNLFDLGLTIQAEADGMLDEDNPLARALLAWGMEALCAFKVAVLVGASLVFYRYRERPCSEIATTFVLLTYTLVALQWKMCYEIYDVTYTNTPNPSDLVILNSTLEFIPAF